jgi:hypothetical protein
MTPPGHHPSPGATLPAIHTPTPLARHTASRAAVPARRPERGVRRLVTHDQPPPSHPLALLADHSLVRPACRRAPSRPLRRAPGSPRGIPCSTSSGMTCATPSASPHVGHGCRSPSSPPWSSASGRPPPYLASSTPFCFDPTHARRNDVDSADRHRRRSLAARETSEPSRSVARHSCGVTNERPQAAESLPRPWKNEFGRSSEEAYAGEERSARWPFKIRLIRVSAF